MSAFLDKELKDELEKLKKETEFFGKTLSYIKNGLGEIAKRYSIKSFDDFIEILRLAWNLEIKEGVELYTLEEAINWFRNNHVGASYTACLLKVKDELSNKITLHHVFINDNKDPVLDGSLPYRIVETRGIDDDLRRLFGDKDLILLK